MLQLILTNQEMHAAYRRSEHGREQSEQNCTVKHSHTLCSSRCLAGTAGLVIREPMGG